MKKILMLILAIPAMIVAIPLIVVCRIMGYDIILQKYRRLEIREDDPDPAGRGPEARRPGGIGGLDEEARKN